MNLDIFKNSDPSGRMSKESFLIKNYKDEYDFIVKYCSENNINSVSFKEKVYLTVNNISIPFCKNSNCSNFVKFKNSKIGYLSYCSTKCVSSDPNIKKIKMDKSILTYGTKTPSESKLIKDRIIETNNKKYGGNSPMSSIIIQDKSKKTLMHNWGVDCPSHNTEILSRRIESFKNSNFKENFKKTCMDKYGVDHHWKNNDIHSKTIDSFYKSYKDRIKSKIDEDKFEFIGFEKKLSTNLIIDCKKCNIEFKIFPYQFYYRINSNINICTNCFPISANPSISQIEIYNFICENYTGEVILDCKNSIKPYEIDIYLPDLKIGFEFNGVWWHCDKFKKNEYHYSKYLASVNKDISLITIWEDDWNVKREICKSIILNKIKNTKDKIYARNTLIKEVSYNDSRIFLDNNHLQGDCKSSIRIGLYYNDVLVSLMTFSKLRLVMNRKESSRNNPDYYELTRFCNIINNRIIGGSSKLLKYFIEKYKPIKIETYSDNTISNGDLYYKLGFKYSHTSKPGYSYVIDGIRSHRFNWSKQKLVNLGYDINKTEEEIMSEEGYYRIYNAGNKKWILNF